jgi:Flp pilus assembly protein TadG
MSDKRPSFFARLRADTRGVSVIEMALIVPVLATLVAGVSDVAMGFSARLKIQQAANRSIDLATVAGLNSVAFTTLQAEAATAAGVTTDHVTVDQWLECAGVRQASFDGTCLTGQQTARFASVTINSSYAPHFPLMQNLSGTSIPLRGYSAVRMQ